MAEEIFEQHNYECENIYDLNKHYININFSILNLNIRSLKLHFDELCVLLHSLDFSPSIIILTETQMKDVIPFYLTDYTIISSPCKHTGHDGISIFYHNSLKNIEFEILDFKTANVIKLSFLLNNHTYLLHAVYRSPSLNNSLFVKELNSI